MTREYARLGIIVNMLLAALTAVFAVALAFVPAVSAYGYEYKSDALIVKYKAGVTPTQSQNVNKKHGLMTEETISRLNAQAVGITDIMPVELKVQELKSDPNVEYAEPDYQRTMSVTSPNDTYYYSYQWNLPKIQADYAWDIQRGSSNVIIAIVDTGVSLNHPDLSGKIVAGYDSVAHDGNPTDENGHGTHVAGIAAAITNNGVGVAGVSWNSRIMPVRVLDASGNGWDSDIAEGIIWAADNGAKVINMSLGGTSSYPQTLQNAVNYAYSRGVIIVAAAGNNPNGEITYPAACTSVIGVAATDSNDSRASFSNYGSFVDVAAPGVSIASSYWTASLGNTYGTGSGTSMATPHVAGLAALVLSQYPSSTPAQVETAIESTAVDLGTPGRDNYYGYGRIDVLAAINYSGFIVDHFTVQAGSPQTAGGPFPVTITARNPAGAVKTNFIGLASLSDTSGTISPAATGSFAAGVWTGNVTITKSGATAITASFGSPPRTGASGQITVNPSSLSYVGVFPSTASVRSGQTLVFSGAGYDRYNNQLSGLSFTWSASGGAVNPGSGASTTFTAGPTLGQFSVTATVNGVPPASAQVNVVADYSLDIFYDYGNATSGVWSMYSIGSAMLPPVNIWQSGPGSWNAARSKTMKADYNNDGYEDIVVFYDYGNATSAIWVFRNNAGTYVAPTSPIWYSGQGNWNANNSKPMIGDYNDDGFDDIVVFYDYGASTSAIWTFRNNAGTYVAPTSPIWASSEGAWDAARSKPMIGDYNDDGFDDIVVFYDYGASTSAIWTFRNNAGTYVAPTSPIWYSGQGNWNANNSKPMIGDYNDDGFDDIVVFYDYGNATSAIWTFRNNAGTYVAPTSPIWASSEGAWDAARSKPMIGDYNNDGFDDIVVFYDYGNATSAIWTFRNNAGTYVAPTYPIWVSGAGCWSASLSALVAN